MSLKINRQSDLDELFSKFATEPNKTPVKKDLSKNKDEKKKTESDKK